MKCVPLIKSIPYFFTCLFFESVCFHCIVLLLVLPLIPDFLFKIISSIVRMDIVEWPRFGADGSCKLSVGW